MMKRIFLPMFLIVSTFLSAQKVYYVQDTAYNEYASDMNPGTDSIRPWRTWQKAFNTAQAGDTVFFREGIWYPTGTESGQIWPITTIDPGSKIGNSGTAESPIVYINYPGEKPELDCRNVIPESGGSIGLNIANTSYLEFIGLTVSHVYQVNYNVNVNGIEVANCGTLTFRNVTVHHCSGAGFFFLGFDTAYIINCDSYYNADSLSITPGNHADGFWIMNGGDDDPTTFDRYTHMEGCRAWLNSDNGIDISSTRWNYCVNNWSFANGALLKGDGGAIKFAYSVQHHTSSRQVYRNISAFNRGGGYTDVNLIGAGPWGQVYNNMSWRDNVGYESGYSEGVKCSKDEMHVIYRNNIAYEPTSTNTGLPTTYQAGFKACSYEYPYYVTQDHNTWRQVSEDEYYYTEVDPAYKVTSDDFLTVDSVYVMSELLADRQKDGSLPLLDSSFHLAPGSDLIDGGVDVGLSFNGRAPDLGAIEFGSISVEITSPEDGEERNAGESIIIDALTKDNQNKIVEVKFYSLKNKKLLGTGIQQTDPDHWQFTWNADTIDSQELRAVAINELGDSATSSIVNFMLYPDLNPEEDDCQISPNPSNGVFWVEFNEILEYDNTLTIVSMDSRNIATIELEKGDFRVMVDLSNFPSGLYSGFFSTNEENNPCKVLKFLKN